MSATVAGIKRAADALKNSQTVQTNSIIQKQKNAENINTLELLNALTTVQRISPPRIPSGLPLRPPE